MVITINYPTFRCSEEKRSAIWGLIFFPILFLEVHNCDAVGPYSILYFKKFITMNVILLKKWKKTKHWLNYHIAVMIPNIFLGTNFLLP